MTPLTGQIAKIGHFLQPTAIAMGQRTMGIPEVRLSLGAASGSVCTLAHNGPGFATGRGCRCWFRPLLPGLKRASAPTSLGIGAIICWDEVNDAEHSGKIPRRGKLRRRTHDRLRDPDAGVRDDRRRA